MSSDLYRKAMLKELLIEPVRNGIYKQKEFHGRGCKIVNMGELFAFPRLFDPQMKRVELNEKEMNKSLVQAGDLLFARRSLTAAGAGKCSIVKQVNEPTTFESSIIRARPNPLLVSSDYLYYYFSSPVGRQKMGAILRQVAVSGITGSDLMELEVECPSLERQTIIGEFFSAIDDRIDLLRETNTTLEAIVHAVFKSWFVDFDPVRAKQEGWDPEGMDVEMAEIFPVRLTKSELGEIPEGWKITRINEALVPKNLRVGDLKVPEYSSTNQGLQLRSELFNKVLSASTDKNKLIHEGDFVFGLSRQVLNFGLMRHTIGCVSPAYKVFSVRNELVSPDFLERTIRYHSGYFFNAVSASSREGQSISSEALGLLRFVQPSDSALNAFYAKIKPIVERIELNHNQIESLIDIRDALLPGLISGKLCLADATEQFSEAITGT